jgi:cobalt-zinc-cadmium efflux system protein
MHNHKHFHEKTGKSDTKNIKLVFFLNFAFMIIEIAGGILTNSMAIMADAAHDFGDCITLATNWFLEEYSVKKDDEKYTYGYRRYSLIGVVINTLVLCISSFLIISEALKRINNPQKLESGGMIILAVAGVAVNGLAVLKLRKSKKLTEKAVMLHLMEDILGWIAVLMASIFIGIFELYIIDTILSMVIAVFILSNVFKNFKETAGIFLQAVPSGYNVISIRKKMTRIKGILDIHDIHLWSLDGINNIISFHCVVPYTLLTEEVVKIKYRLKKYLKYIGINHITIEIEYE